MQTGELPPTQMEGSGTGNSTDIQESQDQRQQTFAPQMIIQNQNHQQQREPQHPLVHQQQRQLNPEGQMKNQNQQKMTLNSTAEMVRMRILRIKMAKQQQQMQKLPMIQQHPVYVPLTFEGPEVIVETSIDIRIKNISCDFNLPFQIDLRNIAKNTHNVVYEPTRGVATKQMRSPRCHIRIHSSGKMKILGCRSEVDCKRVARCSARLVQKLMGKKDERVAIQNYRTGNILATCRLPFGIDIENLAETYKAESTYEPEQGVGLIWRSTTPKATLRIHTTGSIIVQGASSEADVIEVLNQFYPIVLEFPCEHRDESAQKKRTRKAPVFRGPSAKRDRFVGTTSGNSGVINDEVYISDEDEDLYDDLEV